MDIISKIKGVTNYFSRKANEHSRLETRDPLLELHNIKSSLDSVVSKYNRIVADQQEILSAIESIDINKLQSSYSQEKELSSELTASLLKVYEEKKQL